MTAEALPRSLAGNWAAWAIAAADAAWVVGSVAVVEAGLLTAIGNALVAAVAAVVLIFAVLEVRGIRQLGSASA